ncbi:protein-disulfide reductase DsbD [Bradyrhizobium elkanii]|uniref:protein-disulfide reductase DsbD n=1 Tax=Bradyrhizobium elkanii TaxID=29448 RepID=UPI002168E010|nr:protein-disulfide reductase DsbD [Bradyrhizobium elkanii]MCS3474170.1 thiol:disulfide interchange protein DsbD [Bradyrhizobium elkanii]
MPYVRILGFVTLLLGFVAGAALAGAAITPPDQAFRFHAEVADNGGVRVGWSILPGHYLYRDRIQASVNGRPVRIETIMGEPKDDPNFGPTEVYHASTTATVAADQLPDKGSLVVTYQGCAENVICYPPVSKTIDLPSLLVSDVPEGAAAAPASDQTADQLQVPAASTETTTNGLEEESAALFGRGLISTTFAFLGFGILLSLTPCVFPMIPIISGMLARTEGELSLGRSFVLSSAYVLAMAMAYGCLGIFAAWSGENLQAVLQTPAAVLAMSLVFVALALSMFGLYELQLPQSWTTRLAQTSGNRGSVGGAATLGFGSALVVGPCVTPPLAAALIYVGQTGQVLHGSLALFALGLGMGLPLVAFGVLGAKVLPRSGAWLMRTKHIFGFVFLALAVWMLSRVLPVRLVAAASGALFLATGAYLAFTWAQAKPREGAHLAAAALGAVSVAYGGALVAGASVAVYEPLRPLAAIGLVTAPANATGSSEGLRFVANDFRIVTNGADLDYAIDVARKQGRTIMVDFSADWCTECKLMERNVFSQDVVRQAFRGFLLVRADLTHFDRDSKDLMKRFGVVGPPTIVFLSSEGREIQGARIVGDVGVAGFLSKLAKATRA